MAAAGMEIGYSLYAFGEIDAFSYVATALILLFGGLSFKFDNPVYFKFKPVAIGLALAATCLVSYAIDRGIISRDTSGVSVQTSAGIMKVTPIWGGPLVLADGITFIGWST